MTGIEVGVAVIIGILLGRFLPARRKGPKPPPEPICGCTHHHSYHDPATGECNSLMRVPSTGSRMSHHAPCTCRVYSGPVPLPEYFASEITTGDPS
jgi:hypothetical protein